MVRCRSRCSRAPPTSRECQGGRSHRAAAGTGRGPSALGPRSGGWVVANDEGTGPLTASNIRDAWATVLKAAKVGDLHIHDLRHAFATRGASLGANALVLRDALGHKTLAMTGRYVSRQTDPVRELSERIASSILSSAGAEVPFCSADDQQVIPLRNGVGGD